MTVVLRVSVVNRPTTKSMMLTLKITKRMSKIKAVIETLISDLIAKRSTWSYLL